MAMGRGRDRNAAVIPRSLTVAAPTACWYNLANGRFRLDHGSHSEPAPALGHGARDSLGHHISVPGPARYRKRNSPFPPAILLGRNRQRIVHPVVPIAASLLPRNGPYGLRLRAARPERLEPLSAFPIGVGCCIDGAGLRRVWILWRPHPAKSASRPSRHLAESDFESSRAASKVPAIE